MTALETLSPPSTHPVLSFRPEPGGGRWASLLSEFALRRPAHAAEFRRELGLPTDRPVVMTGHQAQVWHPGILSKYLAAARLAQRLGAAAAWVVVDQDVNAPGVVRLPVRRTGVAGGHGAARALRVETWVVDPAAARASGETPTARQPAMRVAPAPTLEAGESWAAPGVGVGIDAIRGALARHAGAGSAAAQVAGAVGELMQPLLGEGREAGSSSLPAGMQGLVVMSLAISRTALFASVLGRMRSDPGACIRAYNAAVRAHPRERIQPMTEDELPLWAIGPEMGAPRRRVRVADLGALSARELAPRALLMTGLLRCAGCDLFIHGTGGGGSGAGHDGYDRITEQWLAEWTGQSLTLAPSVVATATLRLRIENVGPGVAELRRAQWLAHRALHEPGLLDDPGADARKRRMVDEIRRIKRAGGDAKPMYRDMHALLGQTRTAHAARVLELQAAAEGAAGRLADAEIAGDRTWAFPLYERGQLEELRGAVSGAVG